MISAEIDISYRNEVWDENSRKFDNIFIHWKIKHNKIYTAQENFVRFANFKKNIQKIQQIYHERKVYNIKKGAEFGLNKFADLSEEEFQSRYLMKKKIQKGSHHSAPTFNQELSSKLPQVFDWRTKGKVTAVKNQGDCGSCWAFSATETIESAWMIKHNLNNATMIPLAPQQIVDCDGNDDGCGGGDPPTAYQYVMSAGGMDSNSSYPYTGQDGTCAFNKTSVIANINNWNYACQEDDEQTLQQSTFQYGPTSICVDASLSWQLYESGVMSAWDCAWIDILDHCVQAVGWNLGPSAETPYWVVRNSWSADWGENGFIRLEYGENTCGMTDEATYVTSV